MHACDRLGWELSCAQSSAEQWPEGEPQALKMHIEIFTEHPLCTYRILFLYGSLCPCKTYILVADRDKLCANII